MQFDQLKRREFITLLGSTAAAWPIAARAQQPAMPAVGVLRVNPRDSELFAGPFRRYMQAAGWVEGHNVRYDFVWADMSIERMPALTSELVARNIDLVVTFGDPAIRAVQQATRRIPIVDMADDIHCHG
jgi:putative ABC transport system substrate-binding protein